MATISIQAALLDSTDTNELFLMQAGVVVNTGGDTLTHVANGYYTATVSETLSGDYDAQVKVGSTVKVEGLLRDGQTKVGYSTAYSSVSGNGARSVTVTVEDDSSNVVSGAVVNVQTAGGTSLGIYQTTDTLGQASFNLDDGDYLFAISSESGYETHTPEAGTVDEDNEAITLTFTVATGVASEVGWLG